ncbi:hypothetical protein OG216_46975 (plasmid) [Streptomycetaceae bacterium NBC_01309]
MHTAYIRHGATLEVTSSRILYLVVDGLVLETPPSHDRAAHPTLRQGGDIVESATVFEDHGNALTLYGARSTLLGALPRPVFRRLLAEHPTYFESLARSMAHRERRASVTAHHPCCATTTARMARYLCLLVDTLADSPALRIDGFTRADIAYAADVPDAQAEVFFRNQHHAGVLTTSHRTIRIHRPKALWRLSGHASGCSH